jgi:serpin B
MQKVNILIAGLALLVSIGCSRNGSPLSTDNQHSVPFAVAKSSSAREAAIVSDSQLSIQASSINSFSVAMYKLLAADTGNLFFSPYSITAALGMTDAGARGRTESQIRQALSVKLQGDDFHAALNGMDQSLMGHAKATPGLTLDIVNSTWLQSGWDFRVAYLDFLSRYYGAGVNLLDFALQPEQSRVIINTWVADQTSGKIIDLIPKGGIDNYTVLVLTNAIYFLADWLYQFNPSLTQDQTFTRLDNSTVTAPLMRLGDTNKTITLSYSRIGKVSALDLPYIGNRLCMTILLPDSGSFSDFESTISVEKIDSLIQALDTTKLYPVLLPKFTFATGSLLLDTTLQSLGMVDAFDPSKADFSGIDGSKGLYVYRVFHKAFIAVDEKGTEAAAATAVILSYWGPRPPSFTADRPFIFLIRDKQTGAILFMGRVLDPTMQ